MKPKEVPQYVAESIQFDCPDSKCAGHAVFYPQTRAVQHTLPTCELWKTIDGNEEKTADYLIRGGIPLGVPAKAN